LFTVLSNWANKWAQRRLWVRAEGHRYLAPVCDTVLLKGVSNVELAASFLAQDWSLDTSTTGPEDLLPFEPPRSPTLDSGRISEILALVNTREKVAPSTFSKRVFGSVLPLGSQTILHFEILSVLLVNDGVTFTGKNGPYC
jgi:hypothetical protein